MKHPIFIDLDDVISETTRTYPALVTREFGIDATYEEIAHFDLSHSFGLTRAQLEHLFHVVHQEEVLMGFSPVPGVRETLTTWQTAGYPLHVVTGRPPKTREVSLAWLTRENIPFDRFDICDKYGRHDPSQGSFLTLDKIKGRPYTLAVEDSLSMATFLGEAMQVPTFLYNRPWNQTDTPCPTYTRCVSWRDIDRKADLS
ncbi:bifunctional metallophosphatase/5'-nucleotidase [Desulfoluna sp.]|uniref:5' nucleotidase, NT5C type n=1 Tax=Desulfoluna sp. TaxID=2045199 RepID=UPI0026228265|nr:bifunctional metallophosphatase/5'-nucleotidase [Desulfoluna sp.]